MRRNHKPFFLIWLQAHINRLYVAHFIRPQFDTLGISPMVLKPSSCAINGINIHAGNHLQIISDANKPVKLTTWQSKQSQGAIRIGDFCLFAPGVEISSAQQISLGKNCMIAAESIISDCDWHGVYNRIRPFRCSKPVILEDNVWVGTRSIICKGVTIGENSIVGAGSVVTKDVPKNVIVAGNPARIVKEITPQKRMLKREFLFQNGDHYWQQQLEVQEYLAAKNTFAQWLKSCLIPCIKD